MKCYRRTCKNTAVNGSFCSEACRDLVFPQKHISFEEKRLQMRTWATVDPEQKKFEQQVIENLMLTK